jgi:flagellar biosynthesis chaperone FliJ
MAIKQNKIKAHYDQIDRDEMSIKDIFYFVEKVNQQGGTIADYQFDMNSILVKKRNIQLHKDKIEGLQKQVTIMNKDLSQKMIEIENLEKMKERDFKEFKKKREKKEEEKNHDIFILLKNYEKGVEND